MTTNEESSLPAFPPSQVGECASPLTWKALFDAIEDGVCVQSLDSRIVCANSAFADIIGAPLEQIIGRACALREPEATRNSSLAIHGRETLGYGGRGVGGGMICDPMQSLRRAGLTRVGVKASIRKDAQMLNPAAV
jgi:PAS domain-containing protein